MSDRDLIRDYLRSLSGQLARLEPAEAAEVLREIESHLEEAIETRPAAEVLAGFGPPRELAERYIAHVLQGSPPPAGLPAIQRVRQQVTQGLYWATALSGYGLALMLLLTALGKALLPSLGLWTDASGEVAVLGLFEQGPPGMRELLGWWLLPVAAGLACAAFLLTRRLLAVLGRLR